MRISKHKSALGAGLLLLGLWAAPATAQQDDPEARLRTALRSATVQLRQLQDQNAVLLAKQAQDQRDHLDLTQKLAADEQELSQLRQQTQSTQDALTQKLQSASAAADTERNNLAKLQAAYNDTTQAARARDAEANHLEATLVETRKRALSCEAKNGELYKLGIEALDLFDHKGIFDVLTTGEPITKLKRVEMENLVQDKRDKMLENRITHPVE